MEACERQGFGDNGMTLGSEGGGGGLVDEVYCYCWFVASGLPWRRCVFSYYFQNCVDFSNRGM